MRDSAGGTGATAAELGAATRETTARLLRALAAEELLDPPLRAAEAAGCAAADPAALLADLAAAGRLTVPADNLDRCLAEIGDSARGLAEARAGLRRRWAGAAARPPAPAAALPELIAACRRRCAPGDAGASALLARMEQLVGEGHPDHPAAKTRLGLGADAARALPEQVERFGLRFLAVAPGLVAATGRNWSAELAARLPGLAGRLAAEQRARGIAGHVPVPVHPVQLDRVLRAEFAAEFADGRVVELAATAPAEPLLSVRTLRVRDDTGAAAHLKLALEAQLTGAVRGISAAAAAAPRLHGAISRILRLDTGLVPRTGADEPAFAVAADLAAVRFAAAGGRRARCLGAVLRADPAAGCAPGELPLPAAALAAANPLDGRPVLRGALDQLAARAAADGAGPPTPEAIAAAWFDALAEVLIVPAVSLLARWGVALEPHPQNTVLVLRAGMPHRAVVRDFGGTRLLAGGRALTWSGADPHLAELAGTALVDADPGRVADKLAHPLLGNLLTRLLDPLTAAEREAALAALAARLDRAAARLRANHPGGDPDPGPILDRLLGGPLPRKRLLGMRLSGAVTEQDYVPAANPLAPALAAHRAGRAAALGEAGAAARAAGRRRLAAAAAAEGVPAGRLAALAGDLESAAEAEAAADRAVAERLPAARLRARLAGAGAGPSGIVFAATPGLAEPSADSLTAAGHGVHPLPKLRRGLDAAEAAAFTPEAGQVVELRLLGVHPGLLEPAAGAGRDAAALFAADHPEHVRLARAELAARGVPGAAGMRILPVHPWQLRHIIRAAFAPELAAGRIAVVRDLSLAAHPTASLRTLVPHAPDAAGRRRRVKLALDARVTSTRRSISADAALGTPAVAALVTRVLDAERAAARVLPELGGVALAAAAAGRDPDAARARGLSLLIREDPAERAAAPGERLLGATALRGPGDPGAPGLLAELAGDAPERFLARYGADLLGAVLPALWHHGIALEAHLQNTLVRIRRDGTGPARYAGLVLRDFSGLRLHPGRLAAAGHRVPARPGAVTIAGDIAECRDKAHYAAILANLDPVVAALAGTPAERAGLWAVLRAEVERLIAAHPGAPAADLAALRAPTLGRRAFVGMALDPARTGRYVPVPNPLHAPG